MEGQSKKSRRKEGICLDTPIYRTGLSESGRLGASAPGAHPDKRIYGDLAESQTRARRGWMQDSFGCGTVEQC
jgi:hypothetical protein